MEHKNDTTMQKLYKIAKEQTEEENKEIPIAAALADVCNQTSTQFQKIINVIGAMPDSLLKKTRTSLRRRWSFVYGDM